MKWNASCCIIAQVLLLSEMHCFQKVMKMVTGMACDWGLFIRKPLPLVGKFEDK